MMMILRMIKVIMKGNNKDDNGDERESNQELQEDHTQYITE